MILLHRAWDSVDFTLPCGIYLKLETAQWYIRKLFE